MATTMKQRGVRRASRNSSDDTERLIVSVREVANANGPPDVHVSIDRGSETVAQCYFVPPFQGIACHGRSTSTEARRVWNGRRFNDAVVRVGLAAVMPEWLPR